MNLSEHIHKDNMHHAYLLEGEREEVYTGLLDILSGLDFKTAGNPDFSYLKFDTFKISDVAGLKSSGSEAGFSGGKKIFVISANFFSTDSQHALLKMFEEPNPGSHFFVITPNINSLARTLISRFYVVRQGDAEETPMYQEAQKFISMPKKSRIDFLKDFLARFKDKENEDEQDEISDGLDAEEAFLLVNSARSESLKFLNALESALFEKTKNDIHKYAGVFEEIWKSRSLLSQAGTSTKMILENLALLVPVI